MQEWAGMLLWLILAFCVKYSGDFLVWLVYHRKACKCEVKFLEISSFEKEMVKYMEAWIAGLKTLLMKLSRNLWILKRKGVLTHWVHTTIFSSIMASDDKKTGLEWEAKCYCLSINKATLWNISYDLLALIDVPGRVSNTFDSSCKEQIRWTYNLKIHTFK